MPDRTCGATRRELLLAGTAAMTAAQAQPPGRLRIGLIGAGHRAWAHIAVLRAIPEFEIAGIADPTPEFRDRAAALAGPGVPVYPEYRQLLEKQRDLRAVLVASPNCFHAEQAVAGLERGLHVLCEKPMATTMEDAGRMIGAAEKSGRILQIGHQMRYTPIYQKAADLAASGEIGPIRFVSANLFRGDWNPASWRATDPKTGQPAIWRHLTQFTGSSLLEDGIHEIDVADWLAGSRIRRVFAAGGNAVLTGRETIDHAAIAAEYENGVKLEFAFALFAPAAGAVGRVLTFLGDGGLMTVETGRITLRKPGAEPRTVDAPAAAPAGLLEQQVGRDLDIGTYRQALAFAEAIRTGRNPACDGAVGREAIRCPLLAERSMRLQQPAA